jgi:hypothetical protein
LHRPEMFPLERVYFEIVVRRATSPRIQMAQRFRIINRWNRWSAKKV